MPDSSRRPIDGYALITCLVLCIIWGLQQVAIKAAGSDVSPMLQVSVRSGVAALLLLITAKFVLHEKWNPKLRWRDGFLLALGFAGEFFFVAEGLRFTSAAHMSVLLYTAPLFAAVGLAIKLPEERLSVIQWCGVLLAFLGIGAAFLLPALMSHSPAAEGSELWWWGDILGLCSGISWGFTIIVMRVTTVSEAAPTQMLFLAAGGRLCAAFPLCAAHRAEPFRRNGDRLDESAFSDLYRVFRKLSRLVPADQNLLGSSFGDSGLYDADFRRHPFGAFTWGVRRTPLRGGFFNGVLRHHGGAASAFFSAPPILIKLPQDCADSAVRLKEQALNEAAGFG